MKPILFCDKTAYSITDPETSNIIWSNIHKINYPECCECLTATVPFNQEQLSHTEHLISPEIHGFYMVLFLTKVKGKTYCVFIDQRRGRGGEFDMIYVRFRFDEELFNGTIFTGEMVYTQNKWVYYLTGIGTYCGEPVRDNLIGRIQLIMKIMRERYLFSNALNLCHVYLKSMFLYQHIQQILIHSHAKTLYFIPNNVGEKIMTLETEMLRQITDKKCDDKAGMIKHKLRVFKIEQTQKPDVYKLYEKTTDKYVGNALMRKLKYSQLLNNIFKNKKPPIYIKCNYVELFDKWEPIEYVKH